MFFEPLGVGHPGSERLGSAVVYSIAADRSADANMVIADADRRMSVAYVMNKMATFQIVTPIAAALVEWVYDIVNH